MGLSEYKKSPEQFIQSADDALYYSKEMVETRLVQHHRNSGSTLKDFCKVIKTHRTINVLWVLIYF